MNEPFGGSVRVLVSIDVVSRVTTIVLGAALG
jgi:hypothetical protein